MGALDFQGCFYTPGSRQASTKKMMASFWMMINFTIKKGETRFHQPIKKW